MTDTPWWHRSVVYQIYPRSFCDTTGNGVGDLRGVLDHLDHLERLGIDAVWLSPVYPSPMVDHGYDVADYCNVDPMFGSLDDVDELVEELHRRSMRLILDWVPNHTSDRHPWFQAARSSITDPHRNRYVWRAGRPDQLPNNWARAFPAGAPAWTWDAATSSWYLHLFSPEQPDVNWADPDLRADMLDTLRFWLDRGVDGFRLDVVHCIGKPEGLPDWPDEVAAIPAVVGMDFPAAHEHLRAIRSVLDEYDGDRLAVGEIYLLETSQVASYYGSGDELHLAFNFPPLYASWSAEEWRGHIEAAESIIGPVGQPAWVLSNHDNARHRTRYGGDERIARAAALLLLTLRGTPFLYAGEELGLEDASVPPDRVVDPAGGHRDGARAPIPWDSTPTHGWATDDTWLPWPPHADSCNADAEATDPNSMLTWYRRLLALRREQPALHGGSLTLLDAAPGVLRYRREADGPTVEVAINFTAEPTAPELPAGTTVSSANTAAPQGSLAPYEARLVIVGR